jgi:hypothetical protein
LRALERPLAAGLIVQHVAGVGGGSGRVGEDAVRAG